jgi:hypothetical protein
LHVEEPDHRRRLLRRRRERPPYGSAAEQREEVASMSFPSGSSSRLTLVLCPAMTIERFTTGHHTLLWSHLISAIAWLAAIGSSATSTSRMRARCRRERSEGHRKLRPRRPSKLSRGPGSALKSARAAHADRWAPAGSQEVEHARLSILPRSKIQITSGVESWCL